MALVPIALFWCIAAAAFVAPPQALIYLLFATAGFGSFAVIPPQFAGGLTITVTSVLAALLIARVALSRGGVDFALRAAISPKRLLLLFLFLVVAWFATLFFPRFFAYGVDVVPMRGILTRAQHLVPSTQNISQLMYLTLSVLSVFAFCRLTQSAVMRQHALRALCLGAAMAIFTGFLDFATQFVPIEPLLAMMRTATYAILSDVEVLGGKRVIGLMPEASAYGMLCLKLVAFLYFARRAIADDRLRERWAPLLIVALLGCIWLSKSTSAYVGAALFVMVAGLEWVQRVSLGGRAGLRARGLRGELFFVYMGVVAVAAIVILEPTVLAPITEMVDRMVLQKAGSDSFEERGLWRATAWQAFQGTYGLGVGVGSTRASSAVVSVLSSVGVLGAALYYGFVLQTLLRTAAPGDREGAVIVSAVRWSYPPVFLVGFFVGSVDFGVLTGAMYGLATAVGISAMDERQRRLALAGGGRGGYAAARTPGRADWSAR